MDKKAKATMFVYIEMFLGVILVLATIPLLQSPQKAQSAEQEFSALALAEEIRVGTYFASLLTQKIGTYTYAELLAIAPNDFEVQQMLRAQFATTFHGSTPMKLTVSSFSGGSLTFTNKEATGSYRIVSQSRTIQYAGNIYDVKLEVYFAK